MSNYQVVVLILLAIVLIGIFWDNYIISILVFIGGYNFYKISSPINNSSDWILVVLLFFSIFLSKYPKLRNIYMADLQKFLYNAAFLFIKIQIALVYLTSGINKFISAQWRDGTAMRKVVDYDYYFNPNHIDWINLSDNFFLIIGWGVILFEITFPLFIWITKFKRFYLVIGVVFHLGIVYFLSLPEFGFLMIIAYTVYLNDNKLIQFKNWSAHIWSRFRSFIIQKILLYK